MKRSSRELTNESKWSFIISTLGLQLIRDITSGKLDGDKMGSMSVTLHPTNIGSGTFIADTKTAG